MKKTLLFAVAVLFAGAAFSQLKFGALAGPNLSIVSQSFSEDIEGLEAESSSGIGFHIGGFVNYELSDKLSIQAEPQLQVRRQSLDEEVSFDLLGVTTTTKTEGNSSDSFLAIPIMAQIGLNDQVYVEVGPSLAFLLGSSAKGDVTTTVGSESTTAEFDTSSTEGRNGFEFGLGVGAGFAVTDAINVGVRYTRALTDTAEDNEFGGVTINTNYNLITATLGYTLGGE